MKRNGCVLRRKMLHETNRLECRRALCLIACLAAWSPAAFSQASDPSRATTSPARATTSPAATSPAAAPDRMDFIDKILGMVGPAEPTHLTEKARFQLYMVATAGPVPILAE